MEEETNLTNAELIRLHRSLELREYALAAFYPLTHSGITAHHKRAVDREPVSAAHPLLTAPSNIRSSTDLPTECRETAARDAVIQGERQRRLMREHGYQRSPVEPNEPKPWKKPWDK